MPKEFEFINVGAKRAFLDLPREIISQFGSDLNAVQQGKDPFSEFKHVSGSVGPSAIELIENGSPAFRAVYCAKYLNTVYILHAFTKTTNGVDREAMAVAKIRYKEMIAKVSELQKVTKQRRKGGNPKKSR